MKPENASQGIFPQIKDLGERLATFERVQRVRAVALKHPDMHWIEFAVKVDGYADLPIELWDAMQDAVIDGEWRLRDDTQEKWYFYLSCVSFFSALEPGSVTVWDSQHIQMEITRFRRAS
ncbi:MAG: hypothetical protein AAF609_14505 [Cyanobacteria bacterium P01_C01_bin.120]